jgi:thiosulfate/3-mercaptopyruvate sulfurtransferase
MSFGRNHPLVTSFSALLIFVGSGMCVASDRYPQARFLVEPAALMDFGAGAKPVIVDARPRNDYETAHVPGAVWVDHELWAKSFSEGKDRDAWSRRIGGLGIDAKRNVVVYDASVKDAARIWWLLRFWGVDNVRLLNGGWSGWKAGKFPVESGLPPSPEPASFVAAPRLQRLATRKTILDALDQPTLQIVDARSFAEFCGVERLKNKRGGAIPGAKPLEWSDLVDPKTKRFKTPNELRRIFKEAGVDLTKKTVAHCQSGGRASVMAFGLELMGAKDVANYYAGWSEWGNVDSTPIETRGSTPVGKRPDK